jgi:MFS family permease
MKNSFIPASIIRSRISVTVFFFLFGLCFSSWASRIPTIKNELDISDGKLGLMLLALPAGQLTALPFTGRLVARIGSKTTLLIGLSLYSLILILLGSSSSQLQLGLTLYCFGIFANMSNISVNTQSVLLESHAKKPIVSSFHGAWSTAGFAGGSIGGFMIANDVAPETHFMMICGIVLLLILLFHRNLIPEKKEEQQIKKGFQKPDKRLMALGLIGFFNLACEGAMFDWSGIYFHDVVKTEPAKITTGYIAFMFAMASGRFIGDWFRKKFTAQKIIMFSGLLSACGLLTAVIFPYYLSSAIGFFIVGLGVSTVIPVLYATAGKTNIPAGIAIATVSTVSFLGFLIGPPLIGYIAEISNLRISFLVVAVFVLMICFLSSKSSLLKHTVTSE